MMDHMMDHSAPTEGDGTTVKDNDKKKNKNKATKRKAAEKVILPAQMQFFATVTSGTAMLTQIKAQDWSILQLRKFWRSWEEKSFMIAMNFQDGFYSRCQRGMKRQ